MKRAAATAAEKPVLAVFMGSAPAPDALRPIPSFVFPEAAAAALARAARYGEWRTQPEGQVPAFSDSNADAARSTVRSPSSAAAGGRVLQRRRRLLAAAGIATARSVEAMDEEAAVRRGWIGYPVALKAFGPSIVHKTELGGHSAESP